MRRLLVPLACFVAALAGCTSTVSGTGEAVPPPEPLPAEQLVLEVDGVGGLMPYYAYLADYPEIAAYGDGRVYSSGPYDQGRPLLLTKVDPVELAALVAQIEASGLVSESVDYGWPDVVDAGAVSVTVHGQQPQANVTVEALGQGDENLPGAQRTAREQLSALIEKAEKLASGGEPVTPDRLQITQFDASNDTGLPTWPGPAPSTFLQPATSPAAANACGVLHGPDAAAVYPATLSNGQFEWLVDGVATGLVVRPLLPHEEQCAD